MWVDGGNSLSKVYTSECADLCTKTLYRLCTGILASISNIVTIARYCGGFLAMKAVYNLQRSIQTDCAGASHNSHYTPHHSDVPCKTDIAFAKQTSMLAGKAAGGVIPSKTSNYSCMLQAYQTDPGPKEMLFLGSAEWLSSYYCNCLMELLDRKMLKSTSPGLQHETHDRTNISC